MSFLERMNWINLWVILVTYGTYATLFCFQKGDTPLAQVDYVRPMLISMGVGVISAALGAVLNALYARKQGAMQDERDKAIDYYGENIGFTLLMFCMFGGVGMAMAQVPYFWIANGLYLALLVVSGIGSVARIVGYQKGV